MKEVFRKKIMQLEVIRDETGFVDNMNFSRGVTSES